MRISVSKDRDILLTEVYNGILLETSEGNQIGICMRDDTFEINVLPKIGKSKWYRINMKNADIECFGIEDNNFKSESTQDNTKV